MAFTSTETKIVIGYNNAVTPANITAVTLAGGTSADTGYPVANLKYEDMWRMFKTSGTPSTNTDIIIQFAVARQFTAFGLVNHNLFSGGYSVDLAHSPDNVTYTSVGNQALFTDGNILYRFPINSPARAYWRIRLTTSASPRPGIFIGAVFLGVHAALTNNPTDAGVFTTAEVPIDFIQSAGQAKHVRFGPTKYGQRSEFTWERASQLTVFTLLETIGRTNMRKLIAVITPEQVHLTFPFFGEHVFGYLTRITHSPREGASSATHRADVVLNIEGAV